jgi:hypothetical protein
MFVMCAREVLAVSEAVLTTILLMPHYSVYQWIQLQIFL